MKLSSRIDLWTGGWTSDGSSFFSVDAYLKSVWVIDMNLSCRIDLWTGGRTSEKKGPVFFQWTHLKICMGYRHEAKLQNRLVDGWTYPEKKGSSFFSVDAYLKICMG